MDQPEVDGRREGGVKERREEEEEKRSEWQTREKVEMKTLFAGLLNTQTHTHTLSLSLFGKQTTTTKPTFTT